MKHLIVDLRSNVWNESRKGSKEIQNIIETLRWYYGQIVKPQNWNFPRIKTIKNFITLKNNSYMVEGSFFSEGWKKGWDQMVIAKKALIIPDNVKNSTYNINNNLTWCYIRTRVSGDLTQIILNIDSTEYNYAQKVAPCIEDVLKEGTNRGYMIFYAEGIL